MKVFNSLINIILNYITTPYLLAWNQIVAVLEKGKAVLDKHGVPKFFLSCLCALNLFIDKTWDDKEGKKNMKPQTAQAFTKLRSKFKKFLKEDPLQRNFQQKMEEFIAVLFFLFLSSTLFS